MVAEPEQPTTTIRDVAVMRALAHPARVALLNHLASGGSATATECAGVVDLTPSATSYHLRALAKVGLVEAAPGRGDGRERFWRSTVTSYQVDSGTDAPEEVLEARRELIDSFVTWEEALVRRHLARSGSEPQHWQDAAMFHGINLMVTADELVRIRESIMELVEPYLKRTRADPPPAARPVYALVRAFPMNTPLPD